MNTNSPKTKTNEPKKPIHLHVERFFQLRACLILGVALLGIALWRADSKLIELVGDAYGTHYSHIGEYLRNEITHAAGNTNIPRTPTVSGQ